MRIKLNAIWKTGSPQPNDGEVYVSMNDYLIHRWADVFRVSLEGLRLRAAWPSTEGALGLWVAALGMGRRQISISVWRSRDHLKQFVMSPAHLRIMHEYRDAGVLYTNAWTSKRCDPEVVWREAMDRLNGRVEGVLHH